MALEITGAALGFWEKIGLFLIFVVTLGIKGRALFGRVENLEKSDVKTNKRIDKLYEKHDALEEQVSEVRDQMREQTQHIAILSKEMHGFKDMIGLKLDFITSKMIEEKKDDREYKDRTSKNLEHFAAMFTQQVDEISKLRDKIYEHH